MQGHVDAQSLGRTHPTAQEPSRTRHLGRARSKVKSQRSRTSPRAGSPSIRRRQLSPCSASSTPLVHPFEASIGPCAEIHLCCTNVTSLWITRPSCGQPLGCLRRARGATEPARLSRTVRSARDRGLHSLLRKCSDLAHTFPQRRCIGIGIGIGAGDETVVRTPVRNGLVGVPALLLATCWSQLDACATNRPIPQTCSPRSRPRTRPLTSRESCPATRTRDPSNNAGLLVAVVRLLHLIGADAARVESPGSHSRPPHDLSVLPAMLGRIHQWRRVANDRPPRQERMNHERGTD